MCCGSHTNPSEALHAVSKCSYVLSYLPVLFQYGIVHLQYVVVNYCCVLCNFMKVCRWVHLLLHVPTR